MLSAHVLAYLDPATGSVILQAIIGGAAAILVTMRVWWGRVKTIPRRAMSVFRPGREPESQPEQAGSDSAVN